MRGINGATFYNDDCMHVMQLYDDNYFDLAIVDPPYGIGTNVIKNSKNRTNLAQGNEYKTYSNEKKDVPTPDYFIELSRISKNQIIWGANHFADRFNSASSGWIIWDKCVPDGVNFAQCEIGYTSFRCSVKIFRYQWSGMLQGGIGDKRKNEQRIHPAQKPIALYQWILGQFSSSGDRILDTHLGSGSSAIAAYYCDREFTGIEIDTDYFNACFARYKAETAQMRLL